MLNRSQESLIQDFKTAFNITLKKIQMISKSSHNNSKVILRFMLAAGLSLSQLMIIVYKWYQKDHLGEHLLLLVKIELDLVSKQVYIISVFSLILTLAWDFKLMKQIKTQDMMLLMVCYIHSILRVMDTCILDTQARI